MFAAPQTFLYGFILVAAYTTNPVALPTVRKPESIGFPSAPFVNVICVRSMY